MSFTCYQDDWVSGISQTWRDGRAPVRDEWAKLLQPELVSGVKRQPNRTRIHQSVMHALESFAESDWPGLLVVMRDATMSTSRAGGKVER